MLVGFSGKAGSGKSTAGLYLRDRYGFVLRSFAAPLKESAAALLDVSVEELEAWKNDSDIRVVVQRVDTHLNGAMSVRTFLQRYGTEAHREVFDEDFWVDRAMHDLLPDNDVAFTDVRFPNEAFAIRDLGGFVVEVRRTGASAGDHVSERAPVADFLVPNNGTYDELYEQLDRLVECLS